MAAREKIQELDLARVVSMLAVIMIHVSAPYINASSGVTVLGMNLAFILNQLTRFAVPLFVLLSGVSLGFSSSIASPMTFYKKRAVKIGLPYLVWFFIYYAYNLTHGGSFSGVGRLVRALLQGQGAPHLYFIIIVLQFYLLYPLLRKWTEKTPAAAALLAFLCSYAVQELFVLRRSGIDLIPSGIRPYLWLLFPTWAVYFVGGMVLTRPRLERVRNFAAGHPWTVLGTTVVFAGIFVVESKALNALDSIKTSLNLYTVLALLSAFSLWRLLGGFRWVQKLVRFLSAHAMTVYFCHVLVVYQLQKYPVFLRGMSGMLALYVCVTVLSILLAFLLDTAGSWVFGRRNPAR